MTDALNLRPLRTISRWENTMSAFARTVKGHEVRILRLDLPLLDLPPEEAPMPVARQYVHAVLAFDERQPDGAHSVVVVKSINGNGNDHFTTHRLQTRAVDIVALAKDLRAPTPRQRKSRGRKQEVERLLRSCSGDLTKARVREAVISGPVRTAKRAVKRLRSATRGL